MLVLTRKIGEKILIDGNIEITVTDITGSKVRVGIVAPKDIIILRSELATCRYQSKALDLANEKLS